MSTTSIRLPFVQRDGLTRADRYIAEAARDKHDVAVILVTVNGIERLCASLGHARAAEVLDNFHLRLNAMGRDRDSIERIGDRKFAVMLNGLRNPGHVTLAAQKIERIAQSTTDDGGHPVVLKTCIGAVLFPLQGREASELMRFAEIASLESRAADEPVSFYEPSSAERLFNDWGLEKRLKNAMECGDLDLHFQPKYCFRKRAVTGAEGLMRWHEPDIGAISPDVFIQLAESTGQISDLTHFAIQRACKQLSEWKALLPELNVAINVTPSTIQTNEIVDVLEGAVGIWGINASSITVEMTENALMEDRDASHEVLTQIRELGARVSIDDFGTGYSSLAYLKEIPADELKIDRSFVMGMLKDSGDFKIVEHSIRIAKSFGLAVVAEGIENAALLAELEKLGCDYGQGYYISRPIPAAEFEEFCKTGWNGAAALAAES